MFFLCEVHAIQSTEAFTDKYISEVPTSAVLSPWAMTPLELKQLFQRGHLRPLEKHRYLYYDL